MRCTSCECENPEGAKFCIECAAPFTRRCPSCGAENLPRAKFCAECGSLLTAQSQSPVSSSRFQVSDSHPLVPSTQPLAPRSEAERRQLTVMFCDLVGSTPLSQQLDPEELREVILAYQEACAHVIRRFEGYLARYVGDGLLVYFGYPQAHEDDARRAVRAGLDVVEALGALNARLAQHYGVRLAVRIGIH